MSLFEQHQFLTVSETAELLRVSASQVYSLIRSGELVALRVGQRGPWRIDTDVLEHFLLSQYDSVQRAQLWHQAKFAGNNVMDISFD